MKSIENYSTPTQTFHTRALPSASHSPSHVGVAAGRHTAALPLAFTNTLINTLTSTLTHTLTNTLSITLASTFTHTLTNTLTSTLTNTLTHTLTNTLTSTLTSTLAPDWTSTHITRWNRTPFLPHPPSYGNQPPNQPPSPPGQDALRNGVDLAIEAKELAEIATREGRLFRANRYSMLSERVQALS